MESEEGVDGGDEEQARSSSHQGGGRVASEPARAGVGGWLGESRMIADCLSHGTARSRSGRASDDQPTKAAREDDESVEPGRVVQESIEDRISYERGVAR